MTARGFYTLLFGALMLFTALSVGSAGAFLLGTAALLCWALSLLYGRDLHGYEWSNALLMLAGGMVAVYTLFENVIIIYRHQHFSIVINIVSAVATVIIMPLFTKSGGVLGATLAYLAANTIRAIGYIACALYYMNKDKKNNQKIPARN